MKLWLIGAVVVAVASTLPLDVEAKRMGGGKSSGMQRDMPARTSPDAAPGKPAQSQQAAPNTPAAANAAGAAAPKRNWMGPLAGLAAGLGIAALLSHLGMGEGMANIVMMLLIAAVAFFVIRFLLRRFGGGAAIGGRQPPSLVRLQALGPRRPQALGRLAGSTSTSGRGCSARR
jgi:predicted lipid-binding transport protein (Tim44 family)